MSLFIKLKFIINKGITGILRPNGTFVYCSYGKHCVISQSIPEEEGDLCAFFSSSMKADKNTRNSCVYLPTHLTRGQQRWIKSNYKYLDECQKCDLIQYHLFP